MKQWLDFIPLMLFLATFKLLGVYSATSVLLISTVVVYGLLWWRAGTLDSTQRIVVLATLVFGSMTLLLHSDTFIKLKAPVVYGCMAIGFLGSHFYGKQLLIQRMLGHILSMEPLLWARLNLSWAAFSAALGATNLYVAFHYPEHWVTFKVLGSLSLTVLFVIGQMVLLRHYLVTPEQRGE